MAPKPISQNTLFYGDNLPILRDHIADESIDLIYLDPPFNSSRSYNVLFREENGTASDAQIEAFDDTWHWGRLAEETYKELVTTAPDRVATMIGALHSFLGSNQMTAYLVMMAARLVELQRVLKPTGTLYLHCDPTASHYLRIVLDAVFGLDRMANEIVWQRTAVKGDVRRKFGSVHDVILRYTKSNDCTFNVEFGETDEDYNDRFRFDDHDGRGPYQSAPLDSPNPRPNLTYEHKGYKPPAKGWRVSREVMGQLDAEGRLIFPPTADGRIRRKVYLKDVGGPKIADVWTDIVPLQGSGAERLGYPTQKPLVLLERIILASSNEGDVVLDPFCGCGTAVAAAQKLGRRWIGIDITHLAIALQKYRMEAMFPGIQFEVHGEPKDLGAAKQLAFDDKYQFQWWALSLIKARPVGGAEGSRDGKKGSDKGIDGVVNFIDDPKGKLSRIIVQVKGGGVKSGDIRDLHGTVDREGAAIGVFITLEEPTRDMETEAVTAGYYHSDLWQKDYAKIQILTIEQLLAGAELKMPPQHGTFKQAPKASQTDATQSELPI